MMSGMTDETTPRRRPLGEWIATKLAGSGTVPGPVREVEGDRLEIATTRTVVSFWAPWCEPCRMMRPLIDEIAVEYDDSERVEFVRVNVETNPGLAADYGVKSVPALVVVDRTGVEAARLSGLLPKRELDAFIARATSIHPS
jgi:thioredoxin 1